MAADTQTVAMNTRNPDTDNPEGRFRYLVRDALGLDPFTRDQKIFDELKRLKALDVKAVK